jgi:hypothetical protein
LAYCGDILEDGATLSNYGIQRGSTVQVLRKIESVPAPKQYPKFTESDVQHVVSMFRGVSATGFHKISQKEIYKQILDTHPEIRNDLVAMAALRDPIILSTLQSPDTVRRFAEHHRCLIEATETICKVLKTKTQTTKTPVAVETAGDDQLSDSSSSSGSENSPSTSRRGQGALRRVTNEQLANALREFVGSNSLASLSQRDLNSQPSSTSAPSASSSSRNQITSSMFMNALTEVLMNSGRARSADGSGDPETVSAPQPNPPENPTPPVNQDISMDDPDAQMIASFQPQLMAMQEMGLFNKAANIQALMLCNGNLEAAVNFVLSEMNNS